MKTDAVTDANLKPIAEAAKASREADEGFCTCRCCKEKFAYTETITLHYGNGLLYAICIGCVKRGTMLIVARTDRGIEAKVVQQGPLVPRGLG